MDMNMNWSTLKTVEEYLQEEDTCSSVVEIMKSQSSFLSPIIISLDPATEYIQVKYCS